MREAKLGTVGVIYFFSKRSAIAIDISLPSASGRSMKVGRLTQKSQIWVKIEPWPFGLP
jgi:hypothetical protein